MATADNIGARIQKVREERGINRSQLARLAGVTPTAVWNWEEQGRKPRAEVLAKLARALGVSEAYVLTGEGADDPRPRTTVALAIEQLRDLIADVNGMSAEAVRIDVSFGHVSTPAEE